AARVDAFGLMSSPYGRLSSPRPLVDRSSTSTGRAGVGTGSRRGGALAAKTGMGARNGSAGDPAGLRRRLWSAPRHDATPRSQPRPPPSLLGRRGLADRADPGVGVQFLAAALGNRRKHDGLVDSEGHGAALLRIRRRWCDRSLVVGYGGAEDHTRPTAGTSP